MGTGSRLTPLHVLAAGLAIYACAAFAQTTDDAPVRIVRSLAVAADAIEVGSATPPAHQMHLTLRVMSGTGWSAENVLDAAKRAAGILAQCAIRTSIELHEFDGPKRYRSLFTPVSRDLAKRLALPKPAVLFVADTLQKPAFDAEAIGRSNGRTRPEMADTVWIVSGARDLPVVIAHELVHVLADSGVHSDEAQNLMRDEACLTSTRLTPAQCNAILVRASANGLLQPLK